jgi:glycosyltransferase involved in cell wall biosynthesis
VYIAENSLQDNVKITGWISSNEVHDLLLQSDAMILPSFAEGLPVAIMEALAVGRPVLATYIAGIPELITHNKQGVLFHAGDVIAIKKAIKSFINMPEEEIKNMVSSGYASVNERHNIVTEAKKLALLIKGDK